jgi:RNA polymerase sigma factor (sigma-70 family)
VNLLPVQLFTQAGMIEKSDEDLFRELQREQEGPFRALYKRHSRPLFRFIYRFTADAQVAEEILHDVFIELLSSRDRLAGNSSVKSWLYTVARNRSLNHLKAAGRNRVPWEDTGASDAALDAESQLMARDRGLKFAEAEARMPRDLMSTWSLRKQGFDYRAIAADLSIPLGTVKSRFHRLVEFLRKELENENRNECRSSALLLWDDR